MPTKIFPLSDRAASIAFLFIVALSLVMLRLTFGFEYPIPWNDETAFISQAFELFKNNTLYVWGMNQDSTVMWMPPGYMLTLAGVYKLFGYSFEISRWLSTTLYFFSYWVSWHIVRSQTTGKTQLLSLLILTAAFLSPNAIPSANVARMEALYAFIFLLSLVAALRERFLICLSLIVLAATIHFNAVYFLLPISAYFAWQALTRKQTIIAPNEFFVLALAAWIMLSYLAYSVKNIDAFVRDMRFQFAYKLGSPVMSGNDGWLLLLFAMSVPLLDIISFRKFSASTWISLYGVSFLAMVLNGHNMWYYFGYAFGFAFLTISTIAIFQRATGKLIKVMALIIGFGMLHQFWEKSMVVSEHFRPMAPTFGSTKKHFLAENEIIKAREALSALPPGSSVSFGFTGIEPFFFEALASNRLKWSIPGHSVTQVFPPRKLDYRMHCDSSLFPPYLFVYDWDGFPRKGMDTGCKLIKLSHISSE